MKTFGIKDSLAADSQAVRGTDHTFAHAASVNKIVREWYRRCGYQINEVPRISISERRDFYGSTGSP
jgi:predicted ATPase